MKKITAIICVLALILTSVIGIMPAYAESPDARIELLNADIGNICFDKVPLFKLTLQTNNDSPVTGQIVYSVTDENGVEYWSKTEDVSYQSNAQAIRMFYADADRYGMLYMTVTYTDNRGSESVSAEYAVATENYKLSDYMSAATHIWAHSAEKKTTESVDKTSQAATKGGFGFVRDNYNWVAVERASAVGTYVDESVISDYTGVMMNAGAGTILNLTSGHPSYDYNTADDCVQMPYSETGVAAFAKFCGQAAKWYKNKNVDFQIWNEQDHPNFAGRANPTAEEYYNLIKAAYTAIKDVDETIIVSTGGFCCIDDDDTANILDDFLNMDGVTKYMDALAIHPYHRHTQYGDESRWSFLERAHRIKNLLKEAQERDGTTDKNIEIWISEYGSPSTTYEWAGATFTNTETEQAAALVRTVTQAKTVEEIGRFSIYNLVNNNRATGHNAHYGLLNGDYTAKPAYLAVSFMNKFTDGMEYAGEVYVNADYEYVGSERDFGGARFKKGKEISGVDEDIFILWEHSDKNATVTIKNELESGNAAVLAGLDSANPVISIAEDCSAKIYDMYGNPVEYEVNTALDLTEEPVYIVCAKEFEVNRNGSKLTVGGKAEPGETVTLMVVDETSLNKKVVAIEQATAGENGGYSLETDVSCGENTLCSLYICEGGNMKELSNGFEPKYIMDEAKWYVDGAEVDSRFFKPADLRAGSTLKVELKLTDEANAASGNIMMIGAIYGSDGMIEQTELDTGQWNTVNKTADMTFEMTVNDSTDVNALKILLWGDKMTPITEGLSISW